MAKAPPPVPEKKAQYALVDRNCREMSGQKVAPNQETIWMLPSEAKFFLANGGLKLFTNPDISEV